MGGLLLPGCNADDSQQPFGSQLEKAGASKENSRQQKTKQSLSSKQDYVRIAREAVEGEVRVQKEAPVDVEYEEGRAIVTFGINLPEGTLGPDYAAKVTMDRETGKVLEILAGS